MIVAIHQPNFFPWYPFFKKMDQADVFVILTHCQFEKNNYQNRFHYNDKWYTLSVNKGLEPIHQKVYVRPNDDWVKIKSNLKQFPLDQFDDDIDASLWATNEKIISRIKSILDIKTTIKLDYPTELNKSERLVDICKQHNATQYLAGRGAKNYMDIEPFERAGIEVIYQEVDEKDMVPIITKL